MKGNNLARIEARDELELVAARIQVDLARAQASPDFGSRLDEVSRTLDSALHELREIAHGIYPHLLDAQGLRPALSDAALNSIVPVETHIELTERLPPELESAIYYCCLEALQNIGKHAGESATAVLALRRRGRVIRFTVSDDGVGFSPDGRPAGSGLANMTDRIASVGGALAVRSVPGEGTTIDGRVVAPLAAAAETGAEQVR